MHGLGHGDRRFGEPGGDQLELALERGDVAARPDALERGVLIPVRLDEHVARHHGDQLAIAQQIGRHAEADVAEPLAEHQQAV